MNGNFFLNAIKSGQNPQQLMLQFLQSTNTPLGLNLAGLAKKGDYAGIEQVARNLCQSRGIDFDTEFKSFCQQMGFK